MARSAGAPDDGNGQKQERYRGGEISPASFTAGQRMFFFFSNRLGCLGSLLISGLITVALLFLFGIVRF